MESFSLWRLNKLKTFVCSVAVSGREAQKNPQAQIQIFELIYFTPFGVPYLKGGLESSSFIKQTFESIN